VTPTATTATRPAAHLAVRRRASVLSEVGRLGIPVLLVSVIVFFSLLKPSTYGTWSNLKAILDAQSVVVILALSAMTPLIVGEFDLSCASIAAFAAAIVIGLPVNQGINPYLGIVITVLACGTVGLFNGIVVVKLRVPSVIATLATATLLSGFWIWYLGAEQQIVKPLPRGFTKIAQGDVPGINLPWPIVYAGIVSVAFWVVLSFLPVGRRMYATGGNRAASFLTGIRTDRIVISSFVAAGTIAGIAGVILGSSLGTAEAGTGTELLLPALAGAFLGATTIRPGRFNVWGAVTSVLALAYANAGLQQLGAQQWVTPVFNGAALIIAVALSGWAFRARASRARREQLRQLQASEPGSESPAADGAVARTMRDGHE